jgi:hypothetical protein
MFHGQPIKSAVIGVTRLVGSVNAELLTQILDGILGKGVQSWVGYSLNMLLAPVFEPKLGRPAPPIEATMPSPGAGNEPELAERVQLIPSSRKIELHPTTRGNCCGTGRLFENVVVN